MPRVPTKQGRGHGGIDEHEQLNEAKIVVFHASEIRAQIHQRLPQNLLFSGQELERVERELNEAKRRLQIATAERREREARDHQ